MDHINIACVGTGYWGKNLVRNFYNLHGCRLKVCCDLDRNLLKTISVQYPGIEVTEEFGRVLEDPAIDAVVLATPATTHYTMARQALKAGKHIYVEKPLTLCEKDAADLCRIAESSGLVLMVGHLLEYHPAILKLKQLVDDGILGEIYYLYAQRMNLGVIRQDENVLWSSAPHDVSIILYLLDQGPSAVSAQGEAYLQAGIEDVVFCTLYFSNRTMAHIQASWLDPHKVRKMTVVGSKKMAVFDDVEATEKIRIYDKGVDRTGYDSYGDALTLRLGDITIPKIDMTEPLKIECQHFLECIRDGRIPRSSGRDGLRVVSVLEAAQRSLRNNGALVCTGRC